MIKSAWALLPKLKVTVASEMVKRKVLNGAQHCRQADFELLVAG